MVIYTCTFCLKLQLGMQNFTPTCHGDMAVLVNFTQVRDPRVLRLRDILLSLPIPIDDGGPPNDGGPPPEPDALIPRPMPHARFRPDPNFLWTDIGQRAIPEIFYTLNVADDGGPGNPFEARELALPIYQKHPAALELFQALSQGAVRFNIPPEGEVMYVITDDFRLIIASREEREHHLPHPTLVGGDEPEVVSAGILHFFEGRISRVCINYSGHFKPNAPSSVEISLALFGRLPLEAFHAHFEGFVIFGLPQVIPLEGTGGGPTPFEVTHHGHGAMDLSRTVAMDINGARLSIVALTDGGARTPFKDRMKEALTKLQHHLVNGRPPPFPYVLLFNRRMYRMYSRILADIQLVAAKGRYKAVIDHSKFLLLKALLESALTALWRPRSALG
ncbi:hypothetical protein MYSTI_02508 [Myxococcus stipitatus DSM 14675]|uniref:Uncharacterized protein n=1 Tax=Myxococcus stipitatus (strain DSM 14675 / JCM 12634 / Mx s8) TaxID=1278073 RepID=L7UBH7_MYXSD|nr:hypothetical protein [Myxococcus stipitatus]AGC43824.1 hypothetical protein MYSTI_02508 [Myxococcus stipitatus DSM 14675]